MSSNGKLRCCVIIRNPLVLLLRACGNSTESECWCSEKVRHWELYPILQKTEIDLFLQQKSEDKFMFHYFIVNFISGYRHKIVKETMISFHKVGKQKFSYNCIIQNYTHAKVAKTKSFFFLIFCDFVSPEGLV